LDHKKQTRNKATSKQPQQETLSKTNTIINMKIIISVLFSALFLSTASSTNFNLRGGSTRDLEALDSVELQEMEQNALDFFAEVGIDLDAPPLDDAQLEQLIEAHEESATAVAEEDNTDENVGAALDSARVDVYIHTVTCNDGGSDLYVEVRRWSGQYWKGTARLAKGSSAISGKMMGGTMKFPSWKTLRAQKSLDMALTTANMAGNFNGAGSFSVSGWSSKPAVATLRGFWRD
jgi:hypothetical protein